MMIRVIYNEPHYVIISTTASKDIVEAAETLSKLSNTPIEYFEDCIEKAGCSYAQIIDTDCLNIYSGDKEKLLSALDSIVDLTVNI